MQHASLPHSGSKQRLNRGCRQPATCFFFTSTLHKLCWEATTASLKVSACHVEEQSIMGSFHSMVDVSIRADDARGLSTQLQSDRLDSVCCLLHDQLADFCAAGEGNLVDASMLGNSCSCNFSRPRHDVQDTCWDPSLQRELANPECAQRSLLSYLCSEQERCEQG